jgi:hypothetical protein
VFGDALLNYLRPQDEELRADYHAGWVLGRLGLSYEELERVLVNLSPTVTTTHPAGCCRAATLRRGFAAGTADALAA